MVIVFSSEIKWVEATFASWLSPFPFPPLSCLLFLWLSFILHTRTPLCTPYRFYDNMLSCLTAPAGLWAAQAPEKEDFPWPSGDRSTKARQRGREQSCKGAIKAKCKNHIPSWRCLPERSWRRARSACGPPSRAPRRSGAGTGTRCSAPQRPARGPGLIWRVSWKRMPSLFIPQLRVPFSRDACWEKSKA